MYNNKIDFFAPKSWDSSLQKHNSNFPTGSLPEPDFDCISENVLETWQKDNKTFKKTEYTMRLVVAGKTYFGSANTKKLAKTRVATEAWNIIRAGTF